MNFPILIDVTLESNNHVYPMEVEEINPSIEIELDATIYSEVEQVSVGEPDCDRNKTNFPILINITLESNNRVYPMEVEETMPSVEIELDMAVYSEAIQVPVYEGEYTVIPIVADNIVLETKDKLCEDDITVVKIPRFSTSNEYGTTFYIGEG